VVSDSVDYILYQAKRHHIPDFITYDWLKQFSFCDRKEEYDEYLSHLGVTNTEVRAERFVDVPSDSLLLENVVVVLANPPNTYSGVTDPVDLVCSRGGDLSMLELMTESGDTRLDRANVMLKEQCQTLRLSMSRPQVSSNSNVLRGWDSLRKFKKKKKSLWIKSGSIILD